MLRVAVLGAELEGLIAAWVLSRHPMVKVDVYDLANGSNTYDGLPVLVQTPRANSLLQELGIPFTSYRPRIGLLRYEKVHQWPHYLWEDGGELKAEASRILYDLASKETRTRHFAADERPPTRRHASRRLRFDFADLRAALVFRARSLDWHITTDRVIDRQQYDRVVLATPLWLARDRLPFRIQPVTTTRRTVAVVVPRVSEEIFRPWDIVHLPYTPEDAAIRATSIAGTLAVEFSGAVTWMSVVSELNFLCRSGYEVVEYRDNLPGVPYPAQLPEWPDWLAPLGSYATWKNNIPLDAVLDRAYALLLAWTKGM